MEDEMENNEEELEVEDVALNTEYVLNVLIDMLIEKGIISEDELKKKLEEGEEDEE